MVETADRHYGQLIEDLRRHSGRRALTDAEVRAVLDRAWSDLRGSVVNEAGLPEMVVRLALARLQRSMPLPEPMPPQVTSW